MPSTSFTKTKQSMVEESILKATNHNIQDFIKRAKNHEVFIQRAYEIGHEILELQKLSGFGNDKNVTFGCAPLLDSNNTDITERLENIVAVRRKIDKFITDAMKNHINFLLYSENRFLCYTKQNMSLDKYSTVSNMLQVEKIKLNEKKKCIKAMKEDAGFVDDLCNIYKTRSSVCYNLVETSVDMDSLKKDYVQCNKDMMYMLERQCGRSAFSFFKTVVAASSEEIPDNQYVTLPQDDSTNAALVNLLEMNLLEPHPNNNRMVRTTRNL